MNVINISISKVRLFDILRLTGNNLLKVIINISNDPVSLHIFTFTHCISKTERGNT